MTNDTAESLFREGCVDAARWAAAARASGDLQLFFAFALLTAAETISREQQSRLA